MSNMDDDIRELSIALEEIELPHGFLEGYDLLECLSHSHGTETYLAQRKGSKQLCIAKCYDRKLYKFVNESGILKSLRHVGLPTFLDEYQNDDTICIVREYVEGTPLDKYIAGRDLSQAQIVALCIKLCDILTYLHELEPSVIHRDIKPQNIIVKDDGSISLIDFDIARTYDLEAETDTQFIGTRTYAPPEQYGFSQTDCRTDIYSFGVLLRYMLTGSEKEEPDAKIYKPLAHIINKCTAFAPKERFANVSELKKKLLAANPKAQRKQKTLTVVCALVLLSLCVFGGIKWYQYVTFDPFAEGVIPAVMSDEERISDAISYMEEKYGTDLFSEDGSYATIGFVKTILTDIYGYDETYVYAMPTAEGPPQENDGNFFPWGFDDMQYVPRDIIAYVAVKVYWKDKVSDYSELKDDTGVYPGVRVALAFCEESGILTGIGRPEDITKGEVALALSNADRVYEATRE